MTLFDFHLKANNVVLPGLILQEILSGIRHSEQFVRLEIELEKIPVELAVREDHVQAALFYNACRSKGVTASFPDILLCAMAYHRNLKILTTDNDFLHYKQHLPIDLEVVQ